MSRGEVQSYLGYIWFQVIDGEVLVGINEERLDELDTIRKIKLPDVGETVDPDEVCAELEAEESSVDIYCPINGTITEINTAVIEDPQIILDDPYDDGWLFRVEPSNMDELYRLEDDDGDKDWDEDDNDDDDDDRDDEAESDDDDF